MSNTIWRRTALAALLALALGGCTVTTSPHGSPLTPTSTSTSAANTPPPFTWEQALDQVVDDAKQIVSIANLQNPQGNASVGSCNDQGDPPYKGLVVMSFDRPADITEADFYQQIAATMTANGWTGGSPPGRHHHGTALHKNGVTAVMRHNPSGKNHGIIDLYGECRITGPQRLGSGGTPIDFST